MNKEKTHLYVLMEMNTFPAMSQNVLKLGVLCV
jgi:hypothetical protein